MSRAFVLMTAMPPTKGHLHLIQYAQQVATDGVVVIVCTQPDEPFSMSRVRSLSRATWNMHNVDIQHLHKTLPQEPAVAVDFWDMWAGFLQQFGIQSDDIIVASELYGKKLAEITGTRFFPYDPDRSLYYSKATDVRKSPRLHFDEILPEFQPMLRKRVTVFGAESTGKTTLSKALAKSVNGAWIFEWARPYLETVGPEVTDLTMAEIWRGQKALQKHAPDLAVDKPFIIQDTDLFSTLGYYRIWDGQEPEGYDFVAQCNESDLYLITQSNIPFEKDPIRYGVDKRESDDQFWIDICEEFKLNYHVIKAENLRERLVEAQVVVENYFDENAGIAYERRGQ